MEISKVIDRSADGFPDHTPHIVATRCLSKPGDVLNTLERFASLRLFVRTVEDHVYLMPTLGQQANSRVEIPQVTGILHDEEKSPAPSP
jgi:hypothetical protein